ncbi:MAG: hypothetical protein J6A51_02175, partial [Clostridia bacterium]|nr:hypothetical protein [Clostridia bacterium]
MSEIEKAIGDGVVKSNKPKRMFFKKLSHGLIKALAVVGVMVATTFFFQGCKNNDIDQPNNNPNGGIVTPVDPTPDDPSIDNPNPDPNPDTPTPPPIIEINPTTINKFVSQYKTEAVNFAKDALDTIAVDSEERFNYAFETNSDGFITAVKAMTVQYSENNERNFIAEKIVLTNPVSVDNAINSEYSQTDIGGQYTRKVLASFNAKQNYCHAEIGNALFSALELNDGQNFYTEVESENQEKQVFEVTHISENNSITVYKLVVDKAENDKELISNLADNEKIEYSIKTHYSLGDYQVDDKNYEMEEFQPESVADLIENYSEYVHTALNENFFPKITRVCFGRTFDENKLVEPEWRIVHENNEITGFQFISKYANATLNEQFQVGNITLAEKLNTLDFIDENASEKFATASENATYSSDFAFGYLKAEQGTRDELLNAIFEAKGMGYEA